MNDTEGRRCWLCERPLGEKVQHHHLVPKARKGRETVAVHPICHRAIHAHATNAQLARMAGSRTALLQIAEVARFVEWVSARPPDFHAPTRKRMR